jgi:hypothetical protein
MHVKEIYVIFIHLFDSGILLIIDLNKKKGKKGESGRSLFLSKIKKTSLKLPVGVSPLYLDTAATSTRKFT